MSQTRDENEDKKKPITIQPIPYKIDIQPLNINLPDTKPLE
jgi:hypothetical protein